MSTALSSYYAVEMQQNLLVSSKKVTAHSVDVREVQ